MTTLNLRLSKTFNLKRLKAKNIIPRLLFYGLLSLGAIFISVPIIWMVSASFMTTNEIFSPQIKLFPDSLRLNNFVTVFTEFNFARYLLSRFIVTGKQIGRAHV